MGEPMSDGVNQKAYKTESAAREFARFSHHHEDVSIIYSPHKDNKNGDYFVSWGDDACSLIRNWEREIYMGKGGLA
jgi:hypothetical protein